MRRNSTRQFYAPSDDDRTDYLLMADGAERYSGGYDHMCQDYNRRDALRYATDQWQMRPDARELRGAREAPSFDDERAYRLSWEEGMRPNFRELRWRPNVKQTDTAPIGDWDEWYRMDFEVNRPIVKMPNHGGGGRKENTEMENMYSTLPLIWQWQQPDWHTALDVTDSSASSRNDARYNGDVYMRRDVV